MAATDDSDERFNKVELEEVPDDDDEEAAPTPTDDLIEPTDYILTDDEPKKTAPPRATDGVFTCYEKALSKLVDTYDESTEPSLAPASDPANDPIALRALQRFEERMNAAAATKSTKDDTSSLAAKGKSPWSTSRKSLENLLKEEDQQLRPTPLSIGDELKSAADSYIRPRRTFDDTGLNYGTILNLYNTTDKAADDDRKSDKEQQPSAIIDTDDKRGE